MSDTAWAAIAAIVTVIFAEGGKSIVEHIRARSSDKATTSQWELGIDTLAYRQTEYLMNQYKVDIKELRAELVEIKATAVALAQQVVERDRKIGDLEEQVATLIVQNREQNMIITTLQTELAALKGATWTPGG